MPSALVGSQLTIERGHRAVIRSLSFRAVAGEALVLTGPNGAGKTTLIRAIAGFLPLAAGVLKLEGGDDDRDLGEQCHYVGHANAVKANLTVHENLAFWAGYLGSDAASVPGALEAFSLTDLARAPAAMLSAGQRRRVGLARLLVARRSVWLLDEPTVSLDATSVRLLAEAVTRHCASGGIAVAATHLPLGLDNARELRLGDPSAEAA
ncbi:MAG: heme ABC exporter ATP-binding protein CcmA [Hyphomicrobiaceae bacterium]